MKVAEIWSFSLLVRKYAFLRKGNPLISIAIGYQDFAGLTTTQWLLKIT